MRSSQPVEAVPGPISVPVRIGYSPFARGTFSNVYRAFYNGQEVAVKKILVSGSQEEKDRAVKLFKYEVHVMTNLSKISPSQYIVKYLGYIYTELDQCLVFQYYQQGSLRKYIEINWRWGWPQIYKSLRQISDAVSFLHNVALYLHNDIKSDNIFVDTDFNLRLGDLGLVTRVNATYQHHRAGTAAYKAPEVETSGTSKKTDIYSCGIVFQELKEWRVARNNEPDKQKIREQIKSGQRESMFANPSCLFSLINRMTDFNPDNRPAIEIVAHELRDQKFELELLSQNSQRL